MLRPLRYIFWKTTRGVEIGFPQPFRVNQYCQYLNYQHLGIKPVESNISLCLVEFLNAYVDCTGLLTYLVLFHYKFRFIYIYIYTSIITHYPCLCDLHTLLFILHFFMLLKPYIYIYVINVFIE